MRDRMRARPDAGYALPSVIAGMFIILVLVASVTSLVTQDLRDSTRNVGTLEARAAGEAGIDEMYSRMVAQPDYLDSVDLAAHPAYANDDPDRLAQIDPNGVVVACRFDGTPCYQVFVGQEETYAGQVNGTLVDYLPGSRAVVIESRAWARCMRDDTERCLGEARYRSTFRRRAFLEYLLVSNSEAVDPIAAPRNRSVADGGEIDGAPCSEPAGTRDPDCLVAVYQSASGVTDRIVGPIHSNDTTLTICGDPQFEVVEVNNPGTGPGWQFATPAACSAGGMPTQTGTGTVPAGTLAPLPGGVLALPTENTVLPTGVPDYFAVARQIAVEDGVHETTDSVVSFVGSQIVVNGNLQSLPDAGVIYVDGDVEVQGGTLDGQLSIVASENIRITGDILYADDDTGVLGAPGSSNDVLGLNAAGSIIIEYPDGAPGEPRDRTIHAAMLAVRNSVMVDRWATSDWRADESIALSAPPTLRIVGAMAGNYRGVFGAYDDDGGPTGTGGELISGFAKDFEYDRRLASTLQPPYFASPERSAWARVDLVELPPGAAGGVVFAAPPTVPPATLPPVTLPPATTVPPTTAPPTTVPPTVPPTTGPPTTLPSTVVRVEDIAASQNPPDASTFTVSATVWVTTTTGADVAGATVSVELRGYWIGDPTSVEPGDAHATGSCVTGPDGRCTVTNSAMWGWASTVRVTNIAKPGHTYSAADDKENFCFADSYPPGTWPPEYPVSCSP